MTEERDWLGDLAAASQAAAKKDMGTPIHGVDGTVVGYEYDIPLTPDGGLPEFLKRADMDKVREWYERAMAAEAAVDDIIAKAEGPEDGHTFCITVDTRVSSAVVGQPHQDGPEFREFGSVMVRAWNLPDALRKAAEMSLDKWMGEEDDD